MRPQIMKTTKSVLLLALCLASFSVSAFNLKPGLYLINGSDTIPITLQAGIEQTSVTAIANVAFVADKYKFRKASAKVKCGTQPEFLFVFNPNGSKMLINGNVFNCATTTDPTMVRLMRMIPKKRSRVINCSYPLLRLHNNQTVQDILKFEMLEEAVYKVTLAQPLEPGEYCFVFKTPVYLFEEADFSRIWGFSVVDMVDGTDK